MSVLATAPVEVHIGWHDGAGSAPWKDMYVPLGGSTSQILHIVAMAREAAKINQKVTAAKWASTVGLCGRQRLHLLAPSLSCGFLHLRSQPCPQYRFTPVKLETAMWEPV